MRIADEKIANRLMIPYRDMLFPHPDFQEAVAKHDGNGFRPDVRVILGIQSFRLETRIFGTDDTNIMAISAQDVAQVADVVRLAADLPKMVFHGAVED